MEFTYNEYKRIIHNLKEEGYEIVGYHQEDNLAEKKVILRHDVDMSLEKAYEFAKIEKDMNVLSTFYILLSSKMYNIASVQSKKIIKAIYNLGHEIGLHFDESIYEFDILHWKCQVVQAIKNECKIMETILDGDVPIRSVSMHIPSKRSLDSDLKIEGIVNSYSKKYFEQWKYVSDSNMQWREDIFAIMREGYNRIHILTHPIWYETEIKTKNEKVNKFIKEKEWEVFQETKIIIPDLEELL